MTWPFPSGSHSYLERQMYLVLEDRSCSPLFASKDEGSRIWLMYKYLILEDTSQLSKLNWCPVPFQMLWSTQVMDVWLMAMTCRRPEPSCMLGHLGLGNSLEPQATPGRTAARLCKVSAVSTVGRKKLSFAAVLSGVWCTKTSQWIWSQDPSGWKMHSCFPLLSFPDPVHLLSAVLGWTKVYLIAFPKVATQLWHRLDVFCVACLLVWPEWWKGPRQHR